MRRALAALGGSSRGASLESPTTPLTGSRLLSSIDDPEDLWSDSGGSEATPLRVGAAFRCVQILAAAVAGCPLRVTSQADRSQVHLPALEALGPGRTPFELWETVVSHLALWGNAYLRKIRARDGRIVDLLPIHPSRVTVEVEDGRAVGRLYVKRFEIDGVTGVSIIGRMRATFSMAASAEKAATRLYEKGMLLSGFLSTDEKLGPDHADIIKERWRAKLSGLDHASEVAVLDKGMKFQQLSMSPADAQFLETRKFQTTEIARLFGVPGWMINDQEKSTSWGAGMEQQFISFVVVTLKPYMQRIEQRVTREVADPRTEKAEFKVEGLLRGDSRARAAFYASGIQHGWLVPNEPRELEDLPPVAWGDQPYRPYNKAAGDSDGVDDPSDPQEGQDDDS